MRAEAASRVIRGIISATDPNETLAFFTFHPESLSGRDLGFHDTRTILEPHRLLLQDWSGRGSHRDASSGFVGHKRPVVSIRRGAIGAGKGLSICPCRRVMARGRASRSNCSAFSKNGERSQVRRRFAESHKVTVHTDHEFCWPTLYLVPRGWSSWLPYSCVE